MIYLDYNATTPVLPEVLDAMLPFYRDRFSNPSSIHEGGRAARAAVEAAREQVALLAGCSSAEVVFTSGGTEANNAAIKGVAAALSARGNHIITTAVEHPSVENCCRYLQQHGLRLTVIGVDRNGYPDLQAMEDAITPETVLITAMAANNETGVIMPVQRIGEIAARHRVLFHCDAVQAGGRILLDDIPANLLSLSGHKLHAPKGVGALIIRKGVKLFPLLHGGAQERHRRSGTENVAGIAAFGKACEIANSSLSREVPRLTQLRDRLERGLAATVPDIVIVAGGNDRLSNTSCICFTGAAADSLLLNLDLAGIAVSSGSACSSGTLKASPVLSAMGFDPKVAGAALRFSLGNGTTAEEIDQLLHLLPPLVERIRGGQRGQ